MIRRVDKYNLAARLEKEKEMLRDIAWFETKKQGEVVTDSELDDIIVDMYAAEYVHFVLVEPIKNLVRFVISTDRIYVTMQYNYVDDEFDIL